MHIAHKGKRYASYKVLTERKEYNEEGSKWGENKEKKKKIRKRNNKEIRKRNNKKRNEKKKRREKENKKKKIANNKKSFTMLRVILKKKKGKTRRKINIKNLLERDFKI